MASNHVYIGVEETNNNENSATTHNENTVHVHNKLTRLIMFPTWGLGTNAFGTYTYLYSIFHYFG